jgi:hypothetical protein
MSAAELERLIQIVSHGAGAVFERKHSFDPIWHCVGKDGGHRIVDSGEIINKDTITAMMRAFMESHDIVRELKGQSEGRLVGLLPQRGTVQ